MTKRPRSAIVAELKQRRPFANRSEEAAVALFRTADRVRRVADSILGAHDLSGQQYNVLRILRGAGQKGLPTLEIVERLVEQTPGITRLVDALERKQLLTRERCTEDRRVVWCRITRAGLKLLAELDQPVRQTAEAAMAGLTPAELPRFLSLLDKIRSALG